MITHAKLSALAAALLLSTAGIALADDATKSTATTTAMNKWACVEGSETGVSTAASSGPAAGIGVANDQTGRETTSSGDAETTGAAPSAAASGGATGTGSANDVSGREATSSGTEGTMSTDTSVARGTGEGMTEKGFRMMLNEQGYTQVSDLHCMNGSWTFHGFHEGTAASLRLNPQTGAIEAQ